MGFSDEDREGFVEISECRGESPGAEVWAPASEPGECEFGLDAAFAGEEFVPFITDNSAKFPELMLCVAACEQE